MTYSATQLEALLVPFFGDETFFVEPGVDIAFHPDAFIFTSEDPSATPKFISKKPVFDARLMLNECGDEYRHRADRKGDVLVYACYDLKNGEVMHVNGQVIACRPGSKAEAQFLAGAALSAAQAAAEPLQTVMAAIREAKLAIPEGSLRALQTALFKA
jgi:hypothetical protein